MKLLDPVSAARLGVRDVSQQIHGAQREVFVRLGWTYK
jgi:hypothetical protein